jgi:hypothetical protein
VDTHNLSLYPALDRIGSCVDPTWESKIRVSRKLERRCWTVSEWGQRRLVPNREDGGVGGLESQGAMVTDGDVMCILSSILQSGGRSQHQSVSDVVVRRY